MRKAICVILSVFMLVTLVGCGASSGNRPAQGNQGKSVNDVLNEKMNENKQTAEDPSGLPSTEASADPQPQTPPAADAPAASKASDGKTTPDTGTADAGPVDVDLTSLSSTMVYSEVNNMLVSPESYIGKKVRMNGTFNYAVGENRYYFACLIADATACCAQGIEFILKTERVFPDEYPKAGAPITVVGIFDTYYEGNNRFCQLIDAVLE